MECPYNCQMYQACDNCGHITWLRIEEMRKYSIMMKAWNVWASYGYIYVNRKYGSLGSYIGSSLGPSALVPNN